MLLRPTSPSKSVDGVKQNERLFSVSERNRIPEFTLVQLLYFESRLGVALRGPGSK